MISRPVSVVLPSDLIDDLCEIGRDSGLSLSSVIREFTTRGYADTFSVPYVHAANVRYLLEGRDRWKSARERAKSVLAKVTQGRTI